MYNGSMTHADVAPAKAQVHGAHPFRSQSNHDKLLNYLKQRLQLGAAGRDSRLERMAQIDRNVIGWQKLSEDDRKRLAERAKTGNAQATNINLPLTFVHMDDMMTYFAQTFSPNRGMFYHTGKPDEATEANQIVTLMNNHAIYTGAFREVCRAIWDILKYNTGGFECNWDSEIGPKLTRDANGTDTLTAEKKWEGNRFTALDMYNTVWDQSVPASRVFKDGEFAAAFELMSHYQLRRKASEGYYFNLGDMLDNDNGISTATYWRNPAEAARINLDESRGANATPDYDSWFAEGPDYVQSSGFELAKIYIRLNPVEFGLIDGPAEMRKSRNRYETWRFTVCNNERIIAATYMNNIHGMIPLFFGHINDDGMAGSQKSAAEILEPLQSFASFLLNVHVQATRKNIWGNTYYDPTIIDLSTVKAGEVSSRIPIKASGYGKDIRNAIFHDGGTLDTKQTLQDLQAVMAVIDQFFPTQSMPSQIASIDRAVDSQVAAVQQGTNRRNHKTARLLDDTLFRQLRFCMYYNIIQYQPDNITVNDFYGREVKIELEKLRNTDIPFIIGQGLKAIDRQAAASALQQIIFALIQNPNAAAQIDVLGLIDYWTSMLDIDVDMKQFHLQQQAPGIGHNGAPPGPLPGDVTGPAAQMTQPGTDALQPAA